MLAQGNQKSFATNVIFGNNICFLMNFITCFTSFHEWELKRSNTKQAHSKLENVLNRAQTHTKANVPQHTPGFREKS